MPLNESNTDLRVNFIEYWETVKGKVQNCSWVTDLRVNKGTVYRIMQGREPAGASEMKRSIH